MSLSAVPDRLGLVDRAPEPTSRPRLDGRETRRGLAALCLVAVLCAAPHIVAGWGWFPGETRDALQYAFGASRMLSRGSLLAGLADRSAWFYSAFSPALALFSRAVGRHPLVAFRLLGFLGAALLPASMGLFVYLVTRRWRPALLGCFVAGLWGGLAGWLWLVQSAVPAVLRGDPQAAFIPTAYYEERFLGEYAGLHSELVSYLAEVPFYPREAGLVLFWPGLALVYSAVARPRVKTLLAAGALIVASAAVYPYYAASGFLALAAGVAVAAPRLPAERRRAWTVAGVSVLAVFAIVTVSLAGRFLAGYGGVRGLGDYLRYLWRLDPKPDSWLPPLVVRPARTLAGHFFMIAVMAWALLSARRRGAGSWREAWSWTGTSLLVVSFVTTIVMGVLSHGAATRRLFNAYGWIVPWRSLVEPLMVLGTALALEALFAVIRRAARLAVLLVPCLSPLHWAVNSGVYYATSQGSRDQQLYLRFAAYGQEVLGRVRLREPLLADAAAIDHVRAAFGVNAVSSRDSAGRDWLSPELRPTLIRLMHEGVLGDVMTAPHGEFATAVLASGECVIVGRAGPFAFLRAQGMPAP